MTATQVLVLTCLGIMARPYATRQTRLAALATISAARAAQGAHHG